jgi:hypothetical protein
VHPQAVTPNDSDSKTSLTRREVLSLIFATYRTSFPYLLIFMIGLLIATWFFTEVVFR